MSVLADKFTAGEAIVAVVGLGYVGLPLAVSFGQGGMTVVGVDPDTAKVAGVGRGESYIEDVPDADVAALVEAGRLSATTDFGVLADADAIVVCVPTPLRKTREPDVSYVHAVAEEVGLRLREGQLVVLESTTYPGTTREMLLERLEETGLKVGYDFFLAFSPERVDPGNADWGIANTPKVVGGITEACTEAAEALYQTICETVHTVSCPEAAEMVKLLENTFRAVNIGLVNEYAQVCSRLGLDVWEIVEAAATKPFGFMPFQPGPGIGGHCIPVDPQYLSWKMRALDRPVRFIDLAEEVNRGMPPHVVEGCWRMLGDVGKTLRGSKVLLLGLAYKPGVGDTRESSALDLARLMRDDGAVVSCWDPHAGPVQLDGEELERFETLDPDVLAAADLAVIVTPHEELDLDLVLEHCPRVYDTRGVTRGCGGEAVVRRL